MTTNRSFSRVLAPTDFSSGSEKAWSLAQRVAAEIILLHVLPATPLDMAASLQVEERNAAMRALQAEHQLGIPRAQDEEELTPLTRVYEGPLTREAVGGGSADGRELAAKLEPWAFTGRAAGCKVRTLLRAASSSGAWLEAWR